MQAQDKFAKAGFLPKKHVLSAALGLLFLFSSALSSAQITPLGDAYTNTADPTTNYGSAATLAVAGASEITYIQFNLTSIPSGASAGQATLKLYVNSVATAGSFNVDYVTGSWSESTIDHSNAPPLGKTIASNVAITTADKNQYILINVTSAVEAWLNGSETNDGLALVANGSFNATFDSKENTTTSHPAELDIVFAGGEGTITGVTTASGSGLTGGGTSGTLDLSLTSACAAKQVLQWSGSAWTCSSAGTGTITGVTAGTDLTGGGTSGNVTLNLNTSALNSTYAQLSAANTFTGNQTVKGNLSATGVVTGSGFQIGSNLFGFGSFANQNAFLGFAGNTSMTGGGNTGIGVGALNANTNGSANTATGTEALISNTSGIGNTGTGFRALLSNTEGSVNTATGSNALSGNTTGYENTASGSYALGSNTTGYDNTASGTYTLIENTTGFQDTADGENALRFNTTGSNNTASGWSVLYSNTTGGNNTAGGVNALYSNTTGGSNTASGSYALYSNTTGGNNTASGMDALSNNTTGSYNTALGFGAGPDASAPALTNSTAIGAFADVTESYALVLGSSAGYNGIANVLVGIDVTSPTNILTILQGGGSAIADGWATYSSRRWKTNIHPLQNALNKVEQLRGVSYDLKDSGKHEIGVIAEEVGAVVPEIVSWEKNGRDAQGVDYARLTALLIEATKEQQAQIQQQQQEISALQAQLKKRAAKEAMLESRLAHLEQKQGHMQLAAARPVQ